MRLALLLPLAACAPAVDPGGPFALGFDITAHGNPLACGEPLTGIGLSGVDVRPRDARFFLHDLTFLDDEGAAIATTIDDDGVWQDGDVALIDGANTVGACDGSEGTRDVVTGRRDAGTVAAVRFTVGVPPERNHLDAATAPAPLNTPGMFWSWAGGFKYVRVEGSTADKPDLTVHLGASVCEGGVVEGYACANDHLATITVPGLTDPNLDRVAFDIGALLAGLDLGAARADGDSVDGCMSFSGDPECPPIYGALGIGFLDEPAVDLPLAFSLSPATL
ncbi:MAG: hypothetical protein RLZZ383_1753 [Pseudomonadota bacterium]|jgi:uncharacterized repeat protein (TIGR04052 family)